MAYTFVKLSGSTDGKAVKIAATSSTGTTVHTAQSGSNLDFITLWATNNNASGVTTTLTLEWGTTTAADGNIKVSIPAQAGLIPVVDRLPLTNSLLVTAFATTANETLIFGFVDRVS